MTKTTITEELRRLASDQVARSQTARLRDVLDEVEAAIAAGVSHATILSALNERGFSMTPKSFADTLFRLRKKRAKGAKATTPPPHVQAPAAPENESSRAKYEAVADRFIQPIKNRFQRNDK